MSPVNCTHHRVWAYFWEAESLWCQRIVGLFNDAAATCLFFSSKTICFCIFITVTVYSLWYKRLLDFQINVLSPDTRGQHRAVTIHHNLMDCLQLECRNGAELKKSNSNDSDLTELPLLLTIFLLLSYFIFYLVTLHLFWKWHTYHFATNLMWV